MEMQDEIRLPVSITDVWTALNDPHILEQAIPGCTSLTQETQTSLSARVKIKIGPVSANFKGNVTLSDMDPPHAYTISGSGTGGVAGSAKGSAKVTLRAQGDETILSYDVSASVSGKIAQLGSRLIESTAKKLSLQFFDNFTNLISPETPETPADESSANESSAN